LKKCYKSIKKFLHLTLLRYREKAGRDDNCTETGSRAMHGAIAEGE